MRPGMNHPLECVFKPRGVAIVGASANPSKRGYQAIKALKEWGYPGSIYPVNPKGGEILGHKVLPTISEIDGLPDLVLICTPAATVPGILQKCADKGIRGAVVLALGFRESGAKGAALESQIRQVVRRTGIKLVGPNTSGIFNTALGLNLVGFRHVPAGNLALLTQSGNVGLAVVSEAANGIHQGFSIYAGVGNETGIGFHEYVEYLEQDSNTSAILLYVEGFKDGKRFLEVARRVSTSKPIILLKGGRSQAGRAAAKSHTGAIAGSYATLHSALKQVGVVEVRRSDELLPVAETLACQPPVRIGQGVAILTDGGGQATLVTDALRNRGIRLARLSSGTRARLKELLGPAAALGNPVDLAGAADSNPRIFGDCLKVLMQDQVVGGVLLVGLFGGYSIRFSESLLSDEVEAARSMARTASESEKTLIVHTLYAYSHSDPLKLLRNQGVPIIESLEVAGKCMAALCERGLHLGKRANLTSVPEARSWAGAFKARQEGRSILLETEARELLSSYGVPFAPAQFCRTEEEAVAAVESLEASAVFKLVSGSVSHKTDAGGVILRIRDAAGASRAFQEIHENTRRYTAKNQLAFDFRGVLVSPVLPPPVTEIIVGVKRDRQYGPVLMFGLGGIAVEVLRDIAFRVLPVGREDAVEMLDQIRASKLLRGIRGRPAADRESLIDLMLSVADCALANPEIVEIELNPVFSYQDRAVGVDARAYLGTLYRDLSRP